MTSKTQKPLGLYTFRFQSEGQHNNTTTIFSSSCCSRRITRGFPPHFQATPSLSPSSPPAPTPPEARTARSGGASDILLSSVVSSWVSSPLCVSACHIGRSQRRGVICRKKSMPNIYSAHSQHRHTLVISFVEWIVWLAYIFPGVAQGKMRQLGLQDGAGHQKLARSLIIEGGNWDATPRWRP